MVQAELFDSVARRLRPAGVAVHGLAHGIRPSVADVWSWMAKMATPVHARVSEAELDQLGERWWAVCDQLGLFVASRRCLLGVTGLARWVEADVPDRAMLVEHVGPAPDEPSFLLWDPAAGVIVGLDTEEWEFRILVGKVVDGEILDIRGYGSPQP
jgi:hypothetical protein